MVGNNFLCKYFMKQLNSPHRVCRHSFPEIHEVNLRTLTERHVITFRKQLINLLYQPAWTILVKLGEINMTSLIILNKTQVLLQGKILALSSTSIYDKCRYSLYVTSSWDEYTRRVLFLCSRLGPQTFDITMEKICCCPLYSEVKYMLCPLPPLSKYLSVPYTRE